MLEMTDLDGEDLLASLGESVALNEAAIAHVINALGEQIEHMDSEQFADSEIICSILRKLILKEILLYFELEKLTESNHPLEDYEE